jgi:hypothetical protein
MKEVMEGRKRKEGRKEGRMEGKTEGREEVTEGTVFWRMEGRKLWKGGRKKGRTNAMEGRKGGKEERRTEGRKEGRGILVRTSLVTRGSSSLSLILGSWDGEGSRGGTTFTTGKQVLSRLPPLDPDPTDWILPIRWKGKGKERERKGTERKGRKRMKEGEERDGKEREERKKERKGGRRKEEGRRAGRQEGRRKD